MGQEAPADLLRKLRGQKLSQKALDEKLLEVIIKLDALGRERRGRRGMGVEHRGHGPGPRATVGPGGAGAAVARHGHVAHSALG